MLELTVLQRYNQGEKRFCDVLGILLIDFESRKVIGDKSTAIFQTKYSDMKNIICNLFTSGKSLKEISRKIGESGMRIAETKFSTKEDTKIVILIED